MNRHGLRQTQGLTDAFHLFNQATEQLTSTYKGLEQRLDMLSGELAASRDERLTQLEEKERMAIRLKCILDALPAGIIVLDGDGYVQQCNSVALDLVGEPLQDVLWRDVITRAFAHDINKEEVSLKDGRILSVSISPLGEEPGQIILLRDITEKQVMQEVLNRNKRLSAMGEMVASLAHQIRTPLASSLLYASHLTRPEARPEDTGRFVPKIMSRLKHLERLVDDMLVFAKGGRFGADKISASSLIAEVSQIMEQSLIENKCTFEFIDHSEEATVRGNRGALLGVLQNLIMNAIEACTIPSACEDTGDAGTDKLIPNIKLVARCTDQKDSLRSVEFLVIDNGPGIPSDVQDRLFEPFFTTKSQGTGLGLAVAQVIANAHNGALWCQSRSYAGTTFGLRLPVINKESQLESNENDNQQ